MWDQPGKGRTKTSERPVSFDRYAIHRPSGENMPLLSVKVVLRKVCGGQTLGLPGTFSKNAGYFPLGCQEDGYCDSGSP